MSQHFRNSDCIYIYIYIYNTTKLLKKYPVTINLNVCSRAYHKLTVPVSFGNNFYILIISIDFELNYSDDS